MLFTYQLFNQETQKQDPSLITQENTKGSDLLTDFNGTFSVCLGSCFSRTGLQEVMAEYLPIQLG